MNLITGFIEMAGVVILSTGLSVWAILVILTAIGEYRRIDTQKAGR